MLFSHCTGEVNCTHSRTELGEQNGGILRVQHEGQNSSTVEVAAEVVHVEEARGRHATSLKGPARLAGTVERGAHLTR